MKTFGLVPRLLTAMVLVSGTPLLAVDQTENTQARISESDFIVDVCVYEMEWIPATSDWPKAKWLERAVVTGVHKGKISVGTKLEYHCSIEEPPKIFNKPFRTVVEGELFTFFFSAGEGTTFKNGKYTVEAPNNFFRFERLENDDFAIAFRKELGSNPQLRAPSLQYAPPADSKPSK